MISSSIGFIAASERVLLTSLEHALEPELVAFETLRDVEKKLVERQAALDQSLLVGIGDQTLEISCIALGQTIFPRVRAEDAFLLLPCLPIPGERYNTRILHPLHG